MRSQHELYASRAQRLLYRRGGDAGRGEAAKYALVRSTLRRLVSISRVFAAATEPMVLLRDVRQRQEMRERASDRQPRIDREMCEASVERLERAVIVGGNDRQLAYAFDEVVHAGIGVPAEDTAEQFAKEADVSAKRCGNGIGHGMNHDSSASPGAKARPTAATVKCASDMDDADALAGIRLDVWLDVACLFKTRSEAQKACRGGKVDVNGQTAKPNRLLRPGDELEIGRPFGRKQRVVVRGLADRHVAKSEARLLYEDLTPPPTPEEIETRRLERAYRAAATPPRAPDKRQRRALRKLKGRE